MSDVPNVFLSWSGPRARAMAEALHGFLRRVIQSARPFHSDKDIAAGDFADPEIRAALKSVVFAVVCCTPENVMAPWLNYEAGAIAERLEGCTAPLILGSKPEALGRSPIFRLQAREADKAGTLFVVQSLNAKLPHRLPDDILTESFDTHWARLEETWKAIPAPATKTPVRTDREMLEEVVGLCRQHAARLDGLSTLRPRSEFRVKEGIFKGMSEEDLVRLADAARAKDRAPDEIFANRQFNEAQAASDDFRGMMNHFIGRAAYREKAPVDVDALTQVAIEKVMAYLKVHRLISGVDAQTIAENLV